MRQSWQHHHCDSILYQEFNSKMMHILYWRENISCCTLVYVRTSAPRAPSLVRTTFCDKIHYSSWNRLSTVIGHHLKNYRSPWICPAHTHLAKSLALRLPRPVRGRENSGYWQHTNVFGCGYSVLEDRKCFKRAANESLEGFSTGRWCVCSSPRWAWKKILYCCSVLTWDCIPDGGRTEL